MEEEARNILREVLAGDAAPTRDLALRRPDRRHRTLHRSSRRDAQRLGLRWVRGRGDRSLERLTRPSRPRERHVNALAHGLAGRIATPRERAMLVGRELERDND